MSQVNRAGWGARVPAGGPGKLDPGDVVGICLHWPAMSKPLSTPNAVKSALRGWQNYHMDTKGWSDIAYQEAVDQGGNVYELRGITTQSGANGDALTNQTYGSLLLILAPGEQITVAMVEAVRDRIERHRELYPKSTKIVGHSQIRPEPTACPGPIVADAIARRVFEPEIPNRVTRGRKLLASGLTVLDGIPDGLRPAVEKSRDAIRAELERMPEK